MCCEEERSSQFGGISGGGFVIAGNDAIRSFIQSASKSRHLTPELQDLATQLLTQGTFPYRAIRGIWCASPPTARPPLRCLLAGSHFVFSSPKPREKTEELKARLRKLEEMEERKAYRELVKDIMPKEEKTEPFSSYKDQIGFGIHILLIMFTGYLVGFTAFRALFNHSAVMNTAGGIFGLVCGMLLETVLFIIRTSNQGIASSSTATELKKRQ